MKELQFFLSSDISLSSMQRIITSYNLVRTSLRPFIICQVITCVFKIAEANSIGAIMYFPKGNTPPLKSKQNLMNYRLNQNDSFPKSVNTPCMVLFFRYMTPRGTQTESKLTQVRVSELEKHLNLNPKGRSRLRKFLVFSSEDEAGTANRASKTDKESESEDDTISPVEPPKVIRKSAPARLLTSRKKRRKNAKGTTQKKSLVQKPTVIVNKRKTQQVENKENLNVDRAKAGTNMDTKIESKTQKPPSKMNR